MVTTYNLYIDDSGTRHPDRKIGRAPAHKHDWFAFGGILIRDEDEEACEGLHDQFCDKWQIAYPLHSSDIRAKSGDFHWIKELSQQDGIQFHEELYQLMATAPVTGIACVIDRPGYNARYAERYGNERWQLCKTAFSVAIERAAKCAMRADRKLRVNVERGDKAADRTLLSYYKELRRDGMPFDGANSGKYAPLSVEQLSATLYDFKTKAKSSKLTQLADLYLWPMCMGGYDKNNRPYRRLIEDQKLIDCQLEEADIPHLGIKYSCFELENAKAQIHKNPAEPGFAQPPKGDLVG